jgi:hypothetical protein
MNYLSLFLSLPLTFSTTLMGAYGDDYGCENTTIGGTSYYTSWTPTSITTAEGSCSYEDVPVDIAGIFAGVAVLMGAIWLIAPDSSDNEENKILKLYTSESKLGISFHALPKKYYLRAVINNPFMDDPFLLQGRDQIFEPNFESASDRIRLEFGIDL